MKKSLLGLAAMLYLVSTAFAQDSLNLRLISHLDLWQSMDHLQVQGDLAYVSDELSGFHILNVSDPANLMELGRFSSEHGQYHYGGIFVSGTLAYLTSGLGLTILNIADSTQPVKLHEFFRDNMSAIYVYGTLGIGLTNENLPFVLNLSDLQNIQLLSPDVQGIEGPAEPLGLVGGYLCMHRTTDGGGLYVYDISNPWNVFLVTSMDTQINNHGGFLAGNYAYLTTDSGGLRILDVTNPVQPSVAGICNCGSCYDVTVSGSYAVISKGAGGLEIWNVADPAYPIHASSIATEEPISTVTSSGNVIFAAAAFPNSFTDRALRVVNIATPTAPVTVCYFGAVGCPRRIAINGTTGLIADRYIGLFTINLADPEHLNLMGRAQEMMSGVGDVALRGNYAYLATVSQGLCVFNVQDPLFPERVMSPLDTSHHLYRISISGDYAYAIEGERLLTYDLENPELPVCVDSLSILSPNDDFNTLVAAGDQLFTGSFWGDFSVYSLADPAHPVRTGTYSMPSYGIMDIAVSGHYAILCTDVDMVPVIDFADPFAPTMVSEFLGYAFQLAVSESLLVMTRSGGIDLINISDMLHPVLLGYYPEVEWISDMKINSSNLVTINSYQICLYQFDPAMGIRPDAMPTPQNFSLKPCYPNPFNPCTQIGFDLPQAEKVKVNVFNLSGQLVRTLVNDRLTAGTHAVSFDGSNLSSGVYLCRMETPSFNKTQKMMLIK